MLIVAAVIEFSLEFVFSHSLFMYKCSIAASIFLFSPRSVRFSAQLMFVGAVAI